MTLNINYSIYKIILKTTSHSLHYKLMFFLESENSFLGISHKLQLYNRLTSAEGSSMPSITITGLKVGELAEQTLHSAKLPWRFPS